jgi:hypothetical protein
MLKKQLITAACVVGTLVCGGCGLLFREPPPQLPKRLFAGTHTLRVQVSNSSPTHGIDVDSMREALVKELRAPSNRSRVLVVTEGDADTTLNIDVVSEDARPFIQDPKRDGARWSFRVLITARLTDRQGKQLWVRTHWPIELSHGFYHLNGREITNAWTVPGFRKELNEIVSSQLVDELLYR